MEFSRQEYWSRLPLPSPGGLPDPEVKPLSPVSPALAGRFLTCWASREAPKRTYFKQFVKHQDQDVFCYDDTNLCERCRCVCVFAYQHKSETRVVWERLLAKIRSYILLLNVWSFPSIIYSADIYCALPVCQAPCCVFLCLLGCAFLFCCCFCFLVNDFCDQGNLGNNEMVTESWV